jgi:UDP:flavonoid glycosyltransferase YjiC (YdhE family)
MADILYAWELGAGLGHVGAFLPLARALRAAGHGVHCRVVDDAAVTRLLTAEDLPWEPAPTIAEQTRSTPPLSYADILLRYGYADAAHLGALVTGWQTAMRETGAQLILADHAPTALLAARTLGLPAMLYSSGFCVPPPERPTPNMRAWLPVPPERLQALEDEARHTVNRVLADQGRPAIGGLHELFAVEEDTLLGFPELDHYPARGSARYWGNLPDAGVGIRPPWPALPGKKIFAYLRRACVHHEAALAALYALELPTVVFFPDLPDGLASRFAAPHLVFVHEPVDLGVAADEAALAVTYASLSTTTRFLLAGKPVLLLPWHLEQYLMARRVADLGAGLVMDPERPAAGLASALHRLAVLPEFTAAAQAFAQKYAAFPQAVVVNNLVRRIEAIASPTPVGCATVGNAPKETP